MSFQTQVRYQLQIQSFPSILSRSATNIRAVSFSLVEPCETLTRKASYTNSQKTCLTHNTTQTACDSNSKKTDEGKKTTLVALERKLRRQSFFEHICGSDVSGQKSEACDVSPLSQISCNDVNKICLDEQFESTFQIKLNGESRSRANTSGSLGEYLDLSFTSRDSETTQTPTAQETEFLNFRIKKTSIVKRAFAKFELVPLLDRASALKQTSLLNVDYETEFRSNTVGSDIADLLDELSVYDADWNTVEQAN